MADKTQSGKGGKKEDGANSDPVIIKKYANRRLYNTQTSSYVTLDHLAMMVKEGTDFVVYDAKTGEDITRGVLTHIIVEEEAKGENLLPISFLRHLISFYGDSLQALVPGYLEHSMQSFAQNQEKMRDAMEDAVGGFVPFGGSYTDFEEMGKQNLAIFENAMKMFAPFYAANQSGEQKPRPKEDAPKKTAAAEQKSEEPDLDDLRTQLKQMQKQIDGMSDT